MSDKCKLNQIISGRSKLMLLIYLNQVAPQKFTSFRFNECES